MAGNDRDLGRSNTPGAEDRGKSSTGRVMPYTVCTVHKEMRSADFLVEPQNLG
jgi:hypothetical protein